MRVITINLYTFDELSEVAQRRAISEHWKFVDEYHLNDGLTFDKDYVIESLKSNDYEFFSTGEFYSPLISE